MQFGILGSLRVVVDGGEVALTSPKQRRLLSALLVDVGWVVSTDRLAEVMWGDDQPDDPAGAVHTHVSRLRSLLQQHGVEEPDRLLVTRPPGYALAVEPDQVDAGRFARLVEEARAAPGPQARADLVGEALALWRGPPLAEFDHEAARTEAVRLAELWVGALGLEADALLALGRYAQAANALEPAVARHPLREGLCGQLMVALARCGRQADALAVYRRLRDHLVDELGVEPSADLRRLERAILQQAEDLPWPGPVDATSHGTEPPAPAVERSPTRPANLPDALTSFVGRQQDVDEVAAALVAARIVVLTGVGGVGKSRLAVHVARHVADDYPDGVDLCDLTSAHESSAVPELVATTLGMLPPEGADSQRALVELLRPQRRLLVLDNCEHVLAGVSELVALVGRTCPGVDVLATSRQPLGVAGQQIWPVRPLAVDEDLGGPAVELFRDRAAAVDPTFVLEDADRQVVAAICRRLDGLPLAVELAAARVRSMTPADIADRLDDRFALLTDAPRVVSSRHRNLEAVVDWSYALLPAASRHLFDRLAVLAGGFDIPTAEQVCAGDGLPANEIASRLADLVDHSLVTVDRSGRHARYRLLETLRAYGRTRLQDRGELAAWQRRHAQHFTSVAEEAAVGLEGPEEAQWMSRVDAEFGNLRAAAGWARAAGAVDLALRLPAGLRDAAYYGLRDEVYDWAARAVQLLDAESHPAYPAALVTAGVGWMQRGQLDRARHIGEQVLATSTDEVVALRAHRLLAEVALYEGRLEATAEHGRDVVERARAASRPYDEALGLLYRVHAAAYDGRPEDAAADLAAGWDAAMRAGSPSLEAGFQFLEGETRLDADPGAAIAALRKAIEVAGSVNNRFIEGVARVSVASLQARHGQPDEALAAFREVIHHWRTSGDWTHMWTTLHNLVVLLERVGATQSAAVLLGAVATATTGAPAFGEDAGRLAASARSLRSSLGDDAFAAAEAQGRRMSDDEAVANALEEIDRIAAGAPRGQS